MAEKIWHGIKRNKFKWHPVIDYSKCTNCGLCILSCGASVYSWSPSQNKVFIINPENCVIGCTTCGKVCPKNAITFPEDPSKFVKTAIIKYKIFPMVKKELQSRLKKFPDHVFKGKEGEK